MSAMNELGERQVLALRLAEAQQERDAWNGRSKPAYAAAAKLVAALEKRLQRLDDRIDEAGAHRIDGQ